MFELDQAGKSPVVVFENVGGQRHAAGHQRRRQPQAAGRLPRRRRPATCPRHFASAARNTFPAKPWTRGAWEDVVIEGDDVDLTKLPVPLQFSVDAAPYITAGQIVARDPVTGIDTTGFHRLMLKGKNRLGVSLHSRRRLYEFHRRAEAAR